MAVARAPLTPNKSASERINENKLPNLQLDVFSCRSWEGFLLRWEKELTWMKKEPPQEVILKGFLIAV